MRTQFEKTFPRALKRARTIHNRRRRFTAVFLFSVLNAGCWSGEQTIDPFLLNPALDLTREFSKAQVVQETRRIDFNEPESKSYLLEGWAVNAAGGDQGRQLTASIGERSALQFVILEPRDLDAGLRLSPAETSDAESIELRLEINGIPIPPMILGPGFQLHRFAIPSRALMRGKNTLIVHNPARPDRDLLKPRVFWDHLTIGPEAPVGEPAIKNGEIFLPFGSELTYLAEFPSESYLTLDEIRSDHPSTRLVVRHRLLGNARNQVVRELPAGADSPFVQLSAPGKGWGQISLSATALEEAALANGAGLYLRDVHIRLSAPGETPRIAENPLLLPDERRRPNVLIYLVDALRADHVGSYGYTKATTPRIDEFADDAVLFERTMAQASWTRSAIASIFTGMLPTSHSVLGRKDGLAAEAETLAETLRNSGYETAALVTSGHVGPRWGMAQGFETFELIRKNNMGLRYALSNGVNSVIFEWLDRERTQPFFLYVHTLDPHAPYDPPESSKKEFASDIEEPLLSKQQMTILEELEAVRVLSAGNPTPVNLGTQAWMQGLIQGVIEPTPGMIEDLIALYDAEVHHNDRYFGELLDYLRAKDLYDDTLIVFVSDHGEEFRDHGSWSHGRTLFQEVIRVPLILRFPDSTLPRGARVNGLARQIDIQATILDYLDIPIPRGSRGGSLIPMILGMGNENWEQPSYSHIRLSGCHAESYFDGRWKLICPEAPGEKCRLYDLVEDPDEKRNLAATQPSRVDSLRKLMNAYRDSGKILDAFQADPDEETRKQLEALGYL